jgi:hypothetical protein
MAIGGYFELELNRCNHYPFDDLLHLNTGRNAFEYILRIRKYSKIYIPLFTCDVLLEPLEKLGLNYEFYDVNNQLEPIFDYSKLDETVAILVTNYFGLKTAFIKELSSTVQNLIIDNSQALFAPNGEEIDTFYSPRKFVGVPDGGFANCKIDDSIELQQDESHERFSHLLKRIDLSAEKGYTDFQQNDQSLIGKPIMKMSNLTKKLLKSIDFESIRKIRIENYNFLHSSLKKINLLSFSLMENDVPMVYPLLIENGNVLRAKLTENKIYTAIYWPSVLNWAASKENAYSLTKKIIALPIDQRYDEEDMCNILSIIENE